MAIESMTTFDAVLKIDYLPVLQAQFNNEIVLYNRIKRDRENIVGKKYYFPVQSAWGESTGPTNETGSDIPSGSVFNPPTGTLGNETFIESSGVVRTVYGRFEVSTKVIEATKSDRGSFVQAVDFKLKNVADNLRKDLNWMLQSDGTGAIAQITAGAATTAWTVDNALNLRPNMNVQVWSARSAGTQRVAAANNQTVTDVNYDTNVVTIGAAFTDAVNNDFVFKNTGRGINVMGLLGIVDDSTFVTTLQNINRSTSSYWKSSVLGNSGTKRDLSQVLIQQAEDKAYIRAGGKISAFYSNLGQRNNYVQLVTAERRYVNTMKFDAGFDALEYNGKPWFIDRDAQKNVLFALDESVLRFFMLKDFDWMHDDGAVLRRGSGLTYIATLEAHLELGTYQPNRHVVIRDLNEPSGY
jgi:hypothetical protein